MDMGERVGLPLTRVSDNTGLTTQLGTEDTDICTMGERFDRDLGSFVVVRVELPSQTFAMSLPLEIYGSQDKSENYGVRG